MQIEKEAARKLIRDAVISLFLYALPIILMFLFYYIIGEQPWKHRKDKAQVTIKQHP